MTLTPGPRAATENPSNDAVISILNGFNPNDEPFSSMVAEYKAANGLIDSSEDMNRKRRIAVRVKIAALSRVANQAGMGMDRYIMMESLGLQEVITTELIRRFSSADVQCSRAGDEHNPNIFFIELGTNSFGIFRVRIQNKQNSPQIVFEKLEGRASKPVYTTRGKTKAKVGEACPQS